MFSIIVVVILGLAIGLPLGLILNKSSSSNAPAPTTKTITTTTKSQNPIAVELIPIYKTGWVDNSSRSTDIVDLNTITGVNAGMSIVSIMELADDNYEGTYWFYSDTNNPIYELRKIPNNATNQKMLSDLMIDSMDSKTKIGTYRVNGLYHSPSRTTYTYNKYLI